MKEIIMPFILGVVQGITEFLPISSDGHLALTHNIFGYKQGDLFFDVMLHLATLLVVLQYLGRDFFNILRDAKKGEGETLLRARHLLTLIGIGTIPAVVFGLLTKNEIEKIGSHAVFVALLMILNGGILLLPKYLKLLNPWELGRFTKVRALFVGVAQAAAILPGISRSGCTITGGQLLQLAPLEAFRFSFYLFIPVVTGAVLLELLDLVRGRVHADWQALAIGFCAAYITGTYAFRLLQKILEQGKFYRFGYYCLIVGSASLIYFLVRG